MAENPNFTGMTKAEIAAWATEQGDTISTDITKDEMIVAAEALLAPEPEQEAAPDDGMATITIDRASNPQGLTIWLNGKRMAFASGTPINIDADLIPVLRDLRVLFTQE